MNADIPHLQQLWAEAFGDSAETLNAFFATGFSPKRYHCLRENAIPVSALYWFDCTLDGYKLAYIYAVATAKSHRGKGLARRLMEQTHSILQEKGYAGAILVPGERGLFSFYEGMGYQTATTVTEFSCSWTDTPVPVTPIDSAEYARLRKVYLPSEGIVQEGAILDFWETQGRFYKGTDWLLACSLEDDTLQAQELLGNTGSAPGILKGLNVPHGRFRTPGEGKAFSMLLPLRENCPSPVYFGLALD